MTNQSVGTKALKILRSIAGLLMMAGATPFLIQGGYRATQRWGTPPAADWRWIVIGLAPMAMGIFLCRPLPMDIASAASLTPLAG